MQRPTTLHLALLASLAAFGPVGLAQLPAETPSATYREPNGLVEVTASVEGSGQNYAWVIVNKADSPIIYIELPHYHADTFEHPNGWRQECTFLQRKNAADEPGVCKAIAPPGGGIPPQGQARIAMRLARGGAIHGQGTMKLRLEDGRELQVEGVDVPTASSAIGKLIYPLGLGLILGGFLLIQFFRKRKQPPGPPSDSDGVEPETPAP